MKIDFNNLTKQQVFWLLVSTLIFGLVSYPLIYHPDYDVVTNLALIFIGLIVVFLGIGWARKLEKKMRASRARLTRLISTEEGQAYYAQLPDATKMKIDKIIASKDREHEQNLK